METNSVCRLAAAALVALFFTGLAVPNAHALPIDWVTVGNPGNANDTTGYGAVPEPASLGLTATGGLAALGWLRLRRRRAAR